MLLTITNRGNNATDLGFLPDGRRPVFLGDITDRGPKNFESLSFVIDVCESGQAFCVSGNHDAKLLRKLNGKDIQMSHGIDKAINELDGAPVEFLDRLKKYLDGTISHYVLDEGKLVVAHAGLKESYQVIYLNHHSNRSFNNFCMDSIQAPTKNCKAATV